MKLKDQQIQKVAHLILNRLKEKKVIELKASEAKIIESIIKVIQNDMNAESNLENDARKLLDQYRSQAAGADLDERKMFLMIKKQLAKERKMIL